MQKISRGYLKLYDNSIKDIDNISSTKEEDILKAITLNNKLNHLAFIMDGNTDGQKII